MQRLLKTKHLGNEFRILVKKIGAWEPHVISLCGYSYSPIRLLCFVQRIWMLENALQRFSIIGNALATFPMNACNFIKWWRMIFQRSLNFIRLLRVVFSVITTRSNRMKYFQRCSTPFFLRDDRNDSKRSTRDTSSLQRVLFTMRCTPPHPRLQNVNRYID